MFARDQGGSAAAPDGPRPPQGRTDPRKAIPERLPRCPVLCWLSGQFGEPRSDARASPLRVCALAQRAERASEQQAQGNEC